LKEGRGAEHQFPHLYSQVGVGETGTVDVQRDAVIFVVEVVGEGEFEIVLIGVEVVQDLELVELELELELAKLALLEVLVRDDVLDELIDDDIENEVVVVMEEDTGGERRQGSLDSMSLATYRLRAALPPHWKIGELAIASLG